MNVQNDIFFRPNFTVAFKKLISYDLEASVSVRLLKSVKVLDEQQYAVMTTRDKILKEFAKVDESGEIITNNGMATFEDREKALGFQGKLDELLRDEFELPLEKPVKIDKSTKISAQFLEALEGIAEVEE